MHDRLTSLLFAALFAALTAVGSYIAIPVPGSPVPVVLQNLFVLISGLVLGARLGALSMLTYLILGAIGFPVFAGAAGGPAHFAGPTGGYLVSYPLAAGAAGLVAGRKDASIPRLVFAALVGAVIVYALGLPWLKVRLNLDWSKTLVVGALPFVVGDALKVVAAAFIAGFSRPLFRKSD